MKAKTYVTLAGGGLLVLTACGGTIADDSRDGGPTSSTTRPGVTLADVCKKACPADPDPPKAQIDACLSGKDASGQGCDKEYLALLLCAGGRSVCKDGKTDPNATVQIITSTCAAELFRYQGCVTAGFDAGLRPPG